MMRHRQGVTLIELLVVMVVMAILSTVALGTVRSARAKAYIATMQADLNRLQSAEEAYFVENHQYTTSTTALGFNPSAGVHIALASGGIATGFGAVASHDRLPEEQCAMLVGSEAVSSASGVSTCTQTPNGSQGTGTSGVKP